MVRNLSQLANVIHWMLIIDRMAGPSVRPFVCSPEDTFVGCNLLMSTGIASTQFCPHMSACAQPACPPKISPIFLCLC